VLAEVDYFLRDERPAMNAFMDDLSRGVYVCVAGDRSARSGDGD
jgi:hypothetical protein